MIGARGIAFTLAFAVTHTAAASACIEFDTANANGHSYYVVTAPSECVQLHWKDEHDEIFGNASSLRAHYVDEGKKLTFAMNAGIFTPKFAPGGLHIENGNVLRKLNTNDGAGNFHLMPNGVFYIGDSGAQVCTTQHYIGRKPKPRIATQSGPMLLIDGEVHPKFNVDSPNIRIRNGVGIAGDGRVVFALAQDPVNLYTFAVFFRDQLDCKNALYLDGALSFMYAPDLGETFDGGAYAGILAIADCNTDHQEVNDGQSDDNP